MWITSKSVGTLLALVVFEYAWHQLQEVAISEVRSDDCQKLVKYISFSFTTSPLDKNSGNYCLGSLTIKIGISKAVEGT